MDTSQTFLKLVLDSITEHIAVIDAVGQIKYVNKSWRVFGNNNGCEVGDDWDDLNYIVECDKAVAMGDEFGIIAGEGIRKVIDKEEELFYLEYPCHSPEEKRWFMMRITPFQVLNQGYFVISHQNITERKRAEEEVRQLVRIDGLTGIPNRRTFDEFLGNEMKRCARLKKPICLAMIDIDHFKLLNDTYGHQAGDHCLVTVGGILRLFSNRPGDICARYGGEEFTVVWGETPLENAKSMAHTLLEKISELNVPNSQSPTASYVTASIGLAEMSPGQDYNADELIAVADSLLYRAKRSGRNRVECKKFS